MTNDTQFSQRMTQLAGLDNFSNEIWPVSEDVRVFLEHGRAHPRLDQAATRELEDKCRRVILAGECGEFQDAGVKNDSQDRAWRDATRASAAWLRRTPPLPL